MMGSETGGFAFPRSGPFGANDGMTLRDYFAALALSGSFARGDYDLGQEAAEWRAIAAADAYRFADAMIAERSKP